MTGTIISHYRITSELGKGGMGVVYRAEDTKLDRTVALKLLAPHMLASEADRARFYREARAAAALHHPNIATVFEIDEADDGRPFIAMEFIEGAQLDEGLSDKPLQVERAVAIASQIAEALKAAHDRGIVHRDIKSANVMLTKEGTAKVLDFGLAKTDASTKLTQMGSTVGTIAYMSPEQARGEEVDHRTDLWSLGAVLFEMLTGQLPFPGSYEQAVVYGILNAEPEPLTALRTGVPMELERITQKLLRKDAAHRYQTAGDLIADLQAVDLASIASSPSLRPPASSKTTRGKSKAVVWMSVALLLTSVLALASFLSRPNITPPLKLKSNLLLTGNAGFNYFEPFQLSPDEQWMVYLSWPALDRGRLWLRNMATGAEHPIAGTEGAGYPFWSADGEEIGYLSENRMKAVGVTGSPPRSIEIGSHFVEGATWGSAGTILFRTPKGLFSVSELGGEAARVALDDSLALPEQLAFHPNGVDFVLSINHDGDDDRPNPIFQGSIGGSGLTEVGTGVDAHFADADRMIYVQIDGNATAFKVRYDVDTRAPAGEPEALFASLWTPGGRAALSAKGQTIVYIDRNRLGSVSMKYRWYGLSGRAGPDTISVEPNAWKLSVSPDGSKWAVSGRRMHLYDFERNTLQEYPFGPFPLEYSWSSDSQEILYLRGSGFDIFDLRTGESRRAFSSAIPRIREVHWVPSDSAVLFTSSNIDAHRRELWMADLESDLEYQLLTSEPNVYRARVSPDGRWIAYESGTSNSRKQAYLRTWPDLGAPIRVSRSGANQITWSGSGDRLFYVNGSGKMEYASLSESGGRLQITTEIIPVDLVQLDPFRLFVTAFSVHPDGDRVLLSISGIDHPQERIPLEVVRNW